LFFQGELSSPTCQSISIYQSILESKPTITSLKSKNTRSLIEIYEDINVHSNFELFICKTTCFEEEIKEENWVKEMDK